MTDLPFSKEAQLSRSPGYNPPCPKTGTPKRQCKCPSCVGRRNKRKGQRKQRQARKALGLKPERWKGREANEETWYSAAVRVEVKSGAQVKPIATRYVAARQQSDAAKARGDFRPFVFVAAPDGSQPLVVVRADELQAVVAAFLEEWSE